MKTFTLSTTSALETVGPVALPNRRIGGRILAAPDPHRRVGTVDGKHRLDKPDGGDGLLNTEDLLRAL